MADPIDVLDIGQDISASQEGMLQECAAEITKLSEKHKKAKFKVEIMFVGSRSTQRLVTGVLSLYENGAKLKGEGDALLYMCPGKNLGRNNCEAIILSGHNHQGQLYCAKCGSVWKGAEVHSTVVFSLPILKWTEVLVKYFTLLGHDADIWLKHSETDIRTAMQKDEEKKANGLIAAMNEFSTRTYVYPLASIIKDTASGADLSKCFYAFLTA